MAHRNLVSILACALGASLLPSSPIAFAWQPKAHGAVVSRKCASPPPPLPSRGGDDNGVLFWRQNELYFVTSYANVRDDRSGESCQDLMIFFPDRSPRSFPATLAWADWEKDLALLRVHSDFSAAEVKSIWPMDEVFVSEALLRQLNEEARRRWAQAPSERPFQPLSSMELLSTHLNESANCFARHHLPGLDCAVESDGYWEASLSWAGSAEFQDFHPDGLLKHERLAGIRSREILWVTSRWSSRTLSLMERPEAEVGTALWIWIPQHVVLAELDRFFSGKPSVPRYRVDPESLESGALRLLDLATPGVSYRILCPRLPDSSQSSDGPVGGIDLGGIGGIDLGGIGGIDLGGIGGGGGSAQGTACLVRKEDPANPASSGAIEFLAYRDEATGTLRATGISSLDFLILKLRAGHRPVFVSESSGGSEPESPIRKRIRAIHPYAKNPLTRALLAQAMITARVAESGEREMLKDSDWALLLESQEKAWREIETIEEFILASGAGSLRSLIQARSRPGSGS